jgi:hypothetical protein
MISKAQLEKFHLAAKIIETDSMEGVRSATAVAGEDIVVAILIAVLRREFGSIETYPARPEIEGKVNKELAKAGLIHSMQHRFSHLLEEGLHTKELSTEQYDAIVEALGPK